MKFHRSVIDLIGNTPLLRLNQASDETGCEILGKCEFLNPGQSVKDRPALGIVRDAEAAHGVCLFDVGEQVEDVLKVVDHLMIHRELSSHDARKVISDLDEARV